VCKTSSWKKRRVKGLENKAKEGTLYKWALRQDDPQYIRKKIVEYLEKALAEA